MKIKLNELRSLVKKILNEEWQPKPHREYDDDDVETIPSPYTEPSPYTKPEIEEDPDRIDWDEDDLPDTAPKGLNKNLNESEKEIMDKIIKRFNLSNKK